MPVAELVCGRNGVFATQLASRAHASSGGVASYAHAVFTRRDAEGLQAADAPPAVTPPPAGWGGREFLIKWRWRSYIHCTWCAGSERVLGPLDH